MAAQQGNGRSADRPYVVVSADAHAAPDTLEDFLTYVDPKDREAVAAFGDLSAVAIPMFGGVDPGEVDDTDAVRAVATRRLAGMGVDTEAAAPWLARYGDDWVFPSDAGGRRLAYLEEQGIHAEVVFPGPVLAGGLSPAMYLGGHSSKNLEMVWPALWAYYRWLAEFVAAAPGRRTGCIPIDLHDMDRAVDAIAWAREHDIHGGVMLPAMSLRTGLPGYADDYYEPLWSACEEHGVVVNLHTGASGSATDAKQLYDAKHGGFLGLYEVFVFTRRPLWFMIFGGVFDRHPDLKVVVTENGVQWLPSLVRDMESFFDTHGGAPVRSYLSMRPREYFDRHVFLGGSLMNRGEAEMREEIGVDRLMWGADYPHLEGAAPIHRLVLHQVFGGMPEPDLRRILGGNACRVFGFDEAQLQSVADRAGPTVADLSTTLAMDQIPETFSWSLARPVPLASAAGVPSPVLTTGALGAPPSEGRVTELLTDQLRTMAGAYPDEVAYRNLGDDTSITFAQWDRRSNRLAHGLAARGVARGDRVAIMMEADHILDWIVAYSATHKLGAVAVPLNNRLSPPEVQGILEHAEVAAVLTSGSYGDAVGPLIGTLPSLLLVATVGGPGIAGALALEDVLVDDDTALQAPLDGDDLADIMYTSGTTGKPKGVAVRHSQVARVPNQLPTWTGTGWLTASPVFTFAGLGFIHNPMKAGMVVLHLPAFDAGRWLEIVARERPPSAFVVPAMAQLLIHHPDFDAADLSSLRLLVLGSAPLAPNTLRVLQAKLPKAAVLNSYGMTEGGHATFTMDPEAARTRPGAVGRPTPPVEVRIVDDDGGDLPTGEVGEVWTRNPSGHREYYKDAEATARQWEGGWLHTGDLGSLDADGYLYIVGRKKEMIVRGGMNVYADDVEAALQAHPDVVEAAVVGIPHEVLGEDVAAYVVLQPGSASTIDDLIVFAGGRLADYKVPRQVVVVAELPRNAGGKVVKAQLGSATVVAESGPSR